MAGTAQAERTRPNFASFDCAKAQTRVEKRICANPVISRLDVELGELYKEDIQHANAAQKRRLIREEKYWVKYSRRGCRKLPCFKHAYWSRMAELATFFAPHTLLYAHASDKAPVIKHLLATHNLEFLHGYTGNKGDTDFCREVIDDLTAMKNIRFVDPIVQTMSYVDSRLAPWKQKSKVHGAVNNGPGPLNFMYLCDPNLSQDGDINNISAVCNAFYGLPPFKIFHLPPLKLNGQSRYIFYYDQTYGPMNLGDYHVKPKLITGGGFVQLNVPAEQAAATSYTNGIPNFNSLIEYRHSYYFFALYDIGGEYNLNIESVNPVKSEKRQTCLWGAR